MIYECHSKQLPHPKREDFTSEERGFDARAYEATQIDIEIQNASYDEVWKDEETGKVLFTVSVKFVPDEKYYDNGQGTEVRTYKAHFNLKEGQTAEEAGERLPDLCPAAGGHGQAAGCGGAHEEPQPQGSGH